MNKSKVFFAPFEIGENDKSIRTKINKLLEVSEILRSIQKNDLVGIKLHFGEKDNTGFISPSYVREIAHACKSRAKHTALVETNTIYIGLRSNSISHIGLAYNHGFGFNKIEAPILIADGITGRDYLNVKIDMKHTKNAKIASGIADLDYILGLAHVTGHCQTGLAAAIKNIGMGCASRAGKLEQHSTVLPEVLEKKCLGCGTCLKWCPENAIEIRDGKAFIDSAICIGCGECTVACRVGSIKIKWNENVQNLQEKMAEYSYAVLLKRKKGFINFLTNITKDCDCMAKDDPRIIPDIGILASTDLVAIDKATTDILLKTANCDKLKEGYPEIDWNVQLDYASKIGLGNLDYELMTIS